MATCRYRPKQDTRVLIDFQIQGKGVMHFQFAKGIYQPLNLRIFPLYSPSRLLVLSISAKTLVPVRDFLRPPFCFSACKQTHSSLYGTLCAKHLATRIDFRIDYLSNRRNRSDGKEAIARLLLNVCGFSLRYWQITREKMFQEDNGRVKVYARIRPTARFAQDMIELLPDGKSLNIHCKKDLRRGYINNQILDWSFHLDRVLHNASQSDVYEECAADIVSKGLNGYNGTILAYGQTGAGKTFTMTGSTEKFQHRGIIPRAIQQVYREIRERPKHSVTVRISYLEIYNEHMFDLLCTLPGTVSDPSLMAVTEDDDGFTRVKGLSVHQANSEEEALNLLFEV